MISAMKKRISNNKGLTLIELIIVIAIIGILAVIGITQFGSVTESARVSSDKAMLAEIESAAKMRVATNGKLASENRTLATLKNDANFTKNIDVSSIKFQSDDFTKATSPKGDANITFDENGNMLKPTVTGDSLGW